MFLLLNAMVDFQRTAQRYIPEDRTLHNRRCENLKSYTYMENVCCLRVSVEIVC
jgi:hypothetical protein